MANLAIKGHKTRGSEVIALLEMLGGNKAYNPYGKYHDRVYYINEKGYIDQDFICDIEQLNFIIYTLEQFEEKFPYKIGNKVKYNGWNCTTIGMIWEIDIDSILYAVKGIDFSKCVYAEDLQPYKEQETMEEKDKSKAPILYSEDYANHTFGYKIPNEYEFIGIENNEIRIRKKKPKYPKTYEECCRIVNADPYIRLKYDLSDGQKYSYDVDNLQHYENIRKLLIYRDAYWKIAGEQMGLGEPWKPDWLNVEQDKYVLFTHDNTICSNRYVLGHNILAFPTEEMRDAFYENFKVLIETCKELL